ncbi:MAG: outer membrane protein assembly factor BamC [Ostreibacterium sp.]
MMNKPIFFITTIALLVSACSTSLESRLPDNRPNYKQSRVVNSLEIPPDLTQLNIDDTLVVPELSAADKTDLSTYQRERNKASKKGLADSLKNIYRSGDATWIEIAENPDKVFNLTKQFWDSNGLPLTRVDKKIGIMETDWLEANNGTPSTGIFGFLSGLMNTITDNGIRDKFRTRIDYDGKKSYVYLTHYGATEQEVNEVNQVVNSKLGSNSDSNNYAWIASSRNAELEVEMLRRLNLYLNRHGQQNTANKVAKQETRMTFTQLSDGTPALIINGDFNQAWGLLGIAIDRAGYEINSQNRHKGSYNFAQITDKKVGLLIKEIERSVDTYTVGLADQGKRQIAVVRSHDQKPVSVAEAQTVLQKIAKEIQF